MQTYRIVNLDSGRALKSFPSDELGAVRRLLAMQKRRPHIHYALEVFKRAPARKVRVQKLSTKEFRDLSAFAEDTRARVPGK